MHPKNRSSSSAGCWYEPVVKESVGGYVVVSRKVRKCKAERIMRMKHSATLVSAYFLIMLLLPALVLTAACSSAEPGAGASTSSAEPGAETSTSSSSSSSDAFAAKYAELREQGKSHKAATELAKMHVGGSIGSDQAEDTGVAFVGAVGSAEGAVQVTALGDAVNTTARLASEAGPAEVLVSDSAWTAAAHHAEGVETRRLQLKGRSQPVDVHILGADTSLPDPAPVPAG